MPTYTQATCRYNANLMAGLVAALAAKVAAAPLDTDYLNALSVTASSDVTNVVGTQAQRVITVSFNTPPMLTQGRNTLAAHKAGYTGFVKSSRAEDSAAGIGCQQVRIAYTDPAGGAHSQDITLNGTTPVVLPTSNHAVITSLTLLTVGSYGANLGQITIFDDGGPNALPPVGVVYLPPSFYTMFPDPLGQGTPFQDWMAIAIEKAIGTPVVALAPVLA